MAEVREPLEGDTSDGMTDASFKYGGQVPPPAPEQPSSPVVEKRRHSPSLFWPLVLMGGGVLLLLSNLGYLPWSSWSLLWQLWPVLLIALGVDVLIGRRSFAGAFLSGVLLLVLVGGVVVLILFAQNIPFLGELSRPAEWQVKHVEYPLGDVERATVDIGWSSPPGSLRALHDSDDLIEGEIAYSGELRFDVVVRGRQAEVKLDRRHAGLWPGPFQSIQGEDARWDVRLSPKVLLDLNLDGGSGRGEYDLSELRLDALYLDAGSGTLELIMPASSTFEAVIEGGSGALTIALPSSVGARIELDSGSGAFRPGERFTLVSGERDDDGVWETANWDTAESRIDLAIDQGSGRITMR